MWLFFRKISNPFTDDQIYYDIFVMKIQMSTRYDVGGRFMSHAKEYQHWKSREHNDKRFVSLVPFID